jgi:hypothetical protein
LEVAEEVVLAADRLVVVLAAAAADSVVDLAVVASLEVARVEVGNRLCKYSIIKKAANCSFFYNYSLCHYYRKTLVSSYFIPVNFYYYTQVAFPF